MVGNGGRQEGSLLKTPFYVYPHDTKHKCLKTIVLTSYQLMSYYTLGQIKKGFLDKDPELKMSFTNWLVVMPKVFETVVNAN